MNRDLIASGLLAMLVVACSNAGATAAPSGSLPTSTGTVPPAGTGTTAPTSALPGASGTTFSMAADPEMIGFFADRGALIAWSTRDGARPRQSRVLRADPRHGAWRTLYESDAWFHGSQVSAGRMAISEIRDLSSGNGAFSQKLVLIDLDSGAATLISEFSLSSATFRGGGGGPRRPSGAIALGTDTIAWTHLIEGPGGSITGELRVASLSDPRRSTRIGASAEWIAPLAVDARRLVYVIGGKVDDELRVRDLATGADRMVATGPVGDSSRPAAWMSSAAVTGDWAVWQEQARGGKQSPEPEGTIYAVDLRTGDRRTVDRGAGCIGFTAATRYVALICGRSSRIYDARTLQAFVLTSPAPGVGVQASDDGLIWFDVTPTGRNVVVFRPRN